MATRDLMGERWAKLAHNCGINALVGISGWSTVETLEDASCRRIGIGAVAETLRVADRIGQPVFPIMGMTAEEIVAAVDRRDQDWLDEKMLAYAAGTANTGIASMGQDILKGRRTEIDYLNGYVSTKGREVGIPTPICDALAATVNAGPARQFKSDPGLIDRLAADLRA
jgi:2-dehydropantoate 2-reductase